MAHAESTSPVKMGLPIPNSKLGMWLFLGTEIMFFTAFIGTYIVYRVGSPGWPSAEQTHIRIWAGGLNTFVLILSSYFVVVAHEAMSHKNFKKAFQFVCMTFVLACLFLGIKSYEYYGKFQHDILPGHIPETQQQALNKAVREMDTAVVASGLPAMRDQIKDLNSQVATAEDEAASDRLNSRIADLNTEIAALAHFENDFKTLKDRVIAGTITLHGEQGMETRLEELHEEYPDLMSSVHHPIPILYGNLFASIYFLMTGFHAVHVIVGMVLWGFVLLAGFNGSLDAGWSEWVENSGLYWHFVDLVWIFLFPLIYII